MLATEMVASLDDHGFDDLTDSVKLAALNDRYFEFCALEAWPLLEAEATIAVTAGTSTLTLPSDWGKALTIINTTTGNVLSPERRDTLQKRFSYFLTQRAEPAFYYRLGNAFKIYPVSDASYTLQADYVRIPAALTTIQTGGVDSTPILPAGHHKLLVYGALANLNAQEDDPENSAFFEQLYQAKIEKVRNDLWQWQYDRPDRIIDVFENDSDY